MLLSARYSKYSLGYSHFYKWKDCRLEGPIHYDSLLESKGKFILLCRENYDLSNTHCCWPAKVKNDFKKFDDHLVQGACVKRDVFVYSRSYKTKLIRFAKDSGKIIDLTLPQRVTTQPAFLYERCGIGQGRARCLRGKLYGNYLLASNGSQLALGIKSSKDFFFYDPQTTSWSHHPMKYSGNLIGLASVNWPSSYDYSYNETNKQSDVCKASDLNNLNSPEDLNHEDSTIKDEGTVNNRKNNEENWPKRQRLDVVTT
uniref:Uncharacterized protein n=2 Tax=Tetranychus urticae TaxID=32264 RepID=T1KF29_TETUR